MTPPLPSDPIRRLADSAPRPGRALGGVQAALAAVPGGSLAAATGIIAALRRGKPLHPHGVSGTGRLHVTGGPRLLPDPPADSASRADYPVECRLSWAVGTGPARTDIVGLALRIRTEGEPVDWLFASTGDGAVTRFLLQIRRPGEFGTVTTLLPMDSEHGPVVLRLVADSGGSPARADAHSSTEPHLDTAPAAQPSRLNLAAAIGRGPWRSVGTLTLAWHAADVTTRFDPITHRSPLCRPYPWVRAMREPAYRTARFIRPHPEP